MKYLRLVLPAAVVLAAAVVFAVPAQAQEQQQAPAAVDSNQFYVGDWDFSAQTRDSSVSGVWRINYANGRFTGIVARPGQPPSPIRSFTLRDMRNFTLSVDFNSETWTFTGHLDNAHNITGSVSTRGGIGRLRAQKRG